MIFINQQFNIAIHVLVFLGKHSNEKFSSSELSELVCVHPVQLRKVMRLLSSNELVQTKHGKKGGYTSIQGSLNISLAKVFVIFRNIENDARIFTGRENSDCKISTSMKNTMHKYAVKEYEILKEYYKNVYIGDILTDILNCNYKLATLTNLVHIES